MKNLAIYLGCAGLVAAILGGPFGIPRMLDFSLAILGAGVIASLLELANAIREARRG